MRYAAPRASPKFHVDVGGMPIGPTTVVRAAKDPVQPPQDIETVKIIERCLCRVTLGEDCYVVQGMSGDTKIVPYGASLSKWEEVCEELLDMAVKSETLE